MGQHQECIEKSNMYEEVGIQPSTNMEMHKNQCYERNMEMHKNQCYETNMEMHKNQCYESIVRKDVFNKSNSGRSSFTKKDNILFIVLALIASVVLGLAAMTSFLFVENQKISHGLLELTIQVSVNGSRNGYSRNALDRDNELINYKDKDINCTVYEVPSDQQELAELSSEVKNLRSELASLKMSLLQAQIFNSCSEVLSLSLPFGEWRCMKNGSDELPDAVYIKINETINEFRKGQVELAELSKEASNFKLELASLKMSLLHAQIFNSCSEALSLSLPSGYFLLRSSDQSIVYVYCNMTLSCGGVTGGWARVAQLDFNDTSTPCPTGLSKYLVNNINTCRRSESAAGCSTTAYYSTQQVNYSIVCGKIIGYQVGSTDGFEHYVDHSHVTRMSYLSSVYLDGVSLTYGRHTHHIWSLASTTYAKLDNLMSRCGCVNDIPSFVDPYFSCDQEIVRGSLEALWDGRGCSEHNEAWLYRQLPETTSEDIEMRVCKDEDRANEDILIQSVETYVQ